MCQVIGSTSKVTSFYSSFLPSFLTSPPAPLPAFPVFVNASLRPSSFLIRWSPFGPSFPTSSCLPPFHLSHACAMNSFSTKLLTAVPGHTAGIAGMGQSWATSQPTSPTLKIAGRFPPPSLFQKSWGPLPALENLFFKNKGPPLAWPPARRWHCLPQQVPGTVHPPWLCSFSTPCHPPPNPTPKAQCTPLSVACPGLGHPTLDPELPPCSISVAGVTCPLPPGAVNVKTAFTTSALPKDRSRISFYHSSPQARRFSVLSLWSKLHLPWPARDDATTPRNRSSEYPRCRDKEVEA